MASPCNICEVEWPNHAAACIYLHTAREHDRLQAGLAVCEEHVSTILGGFETYGDERVDALLDHIMRLAHPGPRSGEETHGNS